MQNDPALEILSQFFGIPYNELVRQIESKPVTFKVTPPSADEYRGAIPARNEQTNAGVGNLEMANKINELYNELNQKDKDLRETRKALHSLQETLLDFRRRAENAERDAATVRKSYSDLSAEYNNLLNRHRAVKASLKAAQNNSVYKSSNPFTVASFDPAVPGGDVHRAQVIKPKEVDAIDIPLSAAEEIIRRIQGS